MNTNHTQPLVSFVIRTQGRRLGLLSRALASIARQTHKHVEAVVIEDGIGNAAAAVAAADGLRSGVFVFEQTERAGRCIAGNRGLARAKGDYLGFLDEDDELYPDHAEMLVRALAEERGFRLAYARAHSVACDGLAEDHCRNEVRSEPAAMVPFSRTQLWLRNLFPIQAALFHRSLYEQFGGFDPELEMLEDWDLWIRYSSEQDFLAIDAITSMFRMPAAKRELHRRAALHEPSLSKLRAKHAALRGLHSFTDITAIPAQVRAETSFREALAMTVAACRARFAEILAGGKPVEARRTIGVGDD